jgi:cell division protein FtsL
MASDDEKYMTVDFTKMLMKLSFLALIIVGVFICAVLLISDQFTRTAVYQSREVESKLSKQAIEDTARLRAEFETFAKQAGVDKSEMKAEIARKTR